MQTDSAIELSSLPSTLNLYRRALTSREAGHTVETLPNISVSLSQLKIDQKRLNTYRNLCGASDNGLLPIAYPFIMAFPLHMEILVSKQFPFKPMGMVHLANRITQFKTIDEKATLSIRANLQHIETTDKGQVITIYTQICAKGEPVWECHSDFLKRDKAPTSKTKRPIEEPVKPPNTRRATLSASSKIGRLYAKVSGDANPIHLYSFTAKLFGFKRQIAHGMWAKALCLGQLEQYTESMPVTVDVSFKLPILLPAKLQFSFFNDGENTQFFLKDENDVKPHIVGSITQNEPAR